MASATTRVTAACACKTFNLSVNFPNSSLPLDRALCLCNSCRRFSGSCGISNLPVPLDKPFDPAKYSLKGYKTSNAIIRYFCSNCGAHIGFNSLTDDSWCFATGLWDKTEGIIKWNGCKWVKDTLDGGMSVWFNQITDQDGTKRELRRWMLQDGPHEQVPPAALRKFKRAKAQDGSADRLTAACHCGGVKLYLTRPSEASRKVQSPFPDLILPYHAVPPSVDPKNKTWWLRSNDTKYLAGTCTCKSCRTTLGFEIQTWAFVPKSNIFQDDGKPLDYDMGTLKRYASSKGVWREFCSDCGATIFWHCDWRPDLIDVSAGLFDPEEGARVEDWLDWWTERVSFKEMAVSTSLVRSLEDGLMSWKS